MLGADEIPYLELTEVAELIRTRQVTSTEVTETILQRIESLDPQLLSYVHLMPDAARAAARVADQELGRGRCRGPLHGVPIGVKDLCFTTDAPTASGGTINAGFMSSHDATVVARLRAAGAVILGKLRMTEGAYTTHHPDLPTPVNPWDADTWSGVSSSGSGVAAAAGLAFGTIGTDTGGSIRLPSSANGVTGLKPTWGRVSRYGVTALAQSMDHIGPMARSAQDCAAMLGIMAGEDVNDPTTSLEPVPDYLGQLALTRIPRLGVDRELMESFDEPTRQMLDGVVEVARDLGWSVLEITSPDLPGSAQTWAALCAVETAHEHDGSYPERKDEYGPALAGLIELGRTMSALELERLQEQRRAFTGRLRRMFRSVDMFLLPGVGSASPTVAMLDELGGNPALLSALLTPTAPIDIAGTPSLTLPGGFTDRGTPLGFQLVGADLSEHLLLQAGHAYQSVTDFHRRHPVLSGKARSSR